MANGHSLKILASVNAADGAAELRRRRFRYAIASLPGTLPDIIRAGVGRGLVNL